MSGSQSKEIAQPSPEVVEELREQLEKTPTLNAIKHGDTEYPFAVSMYGVKQLEEKYNMEFADIAPAAKANIVCDKLKYGIISGLKSQRKTFDHITDELAEEIIDQNPALFYSIQKTYIDGWQKYYSVLQLGNS